MEYGVNCDPHSGMHAHAPHVLVVDDDPDIRVVLEEYLGQNEMRVTSFGSGRAMLEAVGREAADLVLLDVRMPGENGLMLVHQLHALTRIPLMFLTGSDEIADRVMGLELGADDYVVKPFSPRELLARIRAVLRRHKQSSERPEREEERRAYRFSGWELNLRTRKLVANDGARVTLANLEFSLLAAFCSSPQRVLSRDQLIGLSRLHNGEVYDRTVDVQVLRLRRKIETDPTRPEVIVTERGVGYMFTPAVETLY